LSAPRRLTCFRKHTMWKLWASCMCAKMPNYMTKNE
jgi:hypothetical protein